MILKYIQPRTATYPLIPNQSRTPLGVNRSLQLLLWSQLVGVAALLLSAVGGTGWETGLNDYYQHFILRMLSVGHGVKG